MNRAELPTGHVLHVEPAYADRGTSDTGTSADNQSLLQGVSEHAVALDEVDPVGDDSKSMAQDDVFKDDAPTGKDEDDDLDEFFDSL